MLKKQNWIARYTLLYLAIALPLLACLLFFGATLYWGSDALLQQYPVMRYVHDILRELFSGKGFDMVRLSLGQDLDTIGTLAYYGLTDPLQWPAALFSGIGVEIYYHFLIFLYIYLSGLLFGIYLRKVGLMRGDDPWLTALAALVFATCGYQTIGIIKNPYYAAGGLYLLVMMTAVERVLRERKWLMMSLSTMLMVFANFYMAFQTSLLAALYCLIRLIARWRESGTRGSLADGLRLLGCYFLGLALSAVVLLPVTYSFLASGRTAEPGGYTASLLHYPWAYYLKLALLFCAPYDYAGYWSLQSFSPLALFGAMLLFAPGRERRIPLDAADRQLRAGFVLLLICLCVPLAGKVFNGFGYVTNRWSYGWAVAVCLVTARGLPELTRPQFRGRRQLALLGVAVSVLMLVYACIAPKLPVMNGAGNTSTGTGMGFDPRSAAVWVGSLSLMAAALALLWLDGRLHADPRGATRLLALVGALCCLVYTVGYGFTAAFGGEFSRTGAEADAAGRTEAAAAELPRDSFYRVDAGLVNDNQAGMLGYNGTSYYWSMIPSWISDTYAGLELPTLRWSFRLYGLNADSYLSALASVRYALRPNSDSASALPLGFEPAGELRGGEVISYENEYALPLGYAFFEVLPEAEYERLDPVRKREALLSAAVLAEGGEGLPLFEGELPCERLEWTLESSDGLELAQNALRGRKGTTLTLRFDGAPDAETYLRIVGTEVLRAEDDTDLSIATSCEAGLGGMYFIRRDGVFNYDQTGVCHRLGWSAEGMKECSLRIMQDGEIGFDQIELLSIPAQFYRDAVSERKLNAWDARPKGNRVEGRMEMPADGILQISLPWSEGWSATVDGEEAKLLRCGGMYMGLRLGEGEHEIKLNYVTPGLIPGACASLAALLVTLALGISRRLRGI